jgi:hypothetical protein
MELDDRLVVAKQAIYGAHRVIAAVPHGIRRSVYML